MKKIWMVFIVLLVLLIVPNSKVYAIRDSFYEGEYISGEYIKKFKSGSSTGKYEQMRFFRRNGDDEPVYCIQLWETLSSDKLLSGYANKQADYADIKSSTWEKIMLISYYGYGYKKHTSDKWYVVTQYMIWMETSPSSTIYFTDSLNGNRITKYEEEMEEINELIENHDNLPSFDNQIFELRYNEEFRVEDINKELNDFEVDSYDTKTADIKKHQLIVKNSVPGDFTVELKKYGIRDDDPIVYIDSDGQNLLAPGNFNPITSTVYFQLPSSDITITKIDYDTKTTTPQGSAQLQGSKFQLIDADNKVIQEKTVLEDGTLTFFNVAYGNYSIKEISAGLGYLVNTNIRTIDVDAPQKNITFINHIIKNTIVFQKYVKNPITGNVQEEEKASFSIYNQQGVLIQEFETDKNGIYQVTLPYGEYLVKQNKGSKNHYYVDDFTILVDTNNKKQIINLYNEEVTANVKIINHDIDTHLPLLEGGAEFKIKNLNTNEYVKDNDEDLVLTTNDYGNTNFYLLSSGTYQVEQISAISGYYVNDNDVIFEITDTSIFQLDSEGKKYIEVIVPNQKKTSYIQVNKYIDYYYNDQFVKTEVDTISIPIYAKENIISKDGVILYDENDEVGVAKIQGNTMISDDLYFGHYYIINPVNQQIIDIVLDSTEKKVIDIRSEIYEYEQSDEEVAMRQFIEVPNTYMHKLDLIFIGPLLILIGFIMLQKDYDNEK